MRFFILFLLTFYHISPSFCNAKTALQALEDQDKVRITQWGDRGSQLGQCAIKAATTTGMDIIIGTHKDYTIGTSRVANAQEKDQIFSFLFRPQIKDKLLVSL